MSNLSEPIGRKSIRRVIRDLKANLVFEANIFLQYEQEKYKSAINLAQTVAGKMENTKDKKGSILRHALIQIGDYNGRVFGMIRAYGLYVNALESYLSELDATFDELLERARKEAEKKINERPKERPDIYG